MTTQPKPSDWIDNHNAINNCAYIESVVAYLDERHAASRGERTDGPALAPEEAAWADYRARSAPVAAPPVIDTSESSYKRTTSEVAPPAQPVAAEPVCPRCTLPAGSSCAPICIHPFHESAEGAAAAAVPTGSLDAEFSFAREALSFFEQANIPESERHLAALREAVGVARNFGEARLRKEEPAVPVAGELDTRVELTADKVRRGFCADASKQYEGLNALMGLLGRLQRGEQRRDAALAQVEALEATLEQTERGLSEIAASANARAESLQSECSSLRQEITQERAHSMALRARVKELEGEREHLLFGCAETYVHFEARQRAGLSLALHQSEWFAIETARMSRLANSPAPVATEVPDVGPSDQSVGRVGASDISDNSGAGGGERTPVATSERAHLMVGDKVRAKWMAPGVTGTVIQVDGSAIPYKVSYLKLMPTDTWAQRKDLELLTPEPPATSEPGSEGSK